MFKKNLQKVADFILDLLFPINCIGCGREGSFLCVQCLKAIKDTEILVCPRCLKPSQGGITCPCCRRQSHLDRLLFFGTYEDKILQSAIHLLKYRYLRGLARPLALLLKKLITQNKIKDFYIIPVPLHKKRFLWRGFNQAELLASELEKITGITLLKDNLVRKVNTRPQVGLTKQEREINIKGSFQLKKPLELLGQSVILIDDVYTTGSTMQECARILKEAGVLEVWGLTLAHG